MSRPFEVGDRVEYVGIKDNLYGHVGTIIRDTGGDFGVCFDKPFTGGHSLSGLCEDGYGWWAFPSRLRLVDPQPLDVDFEPLL